MFVENATSAVGFFADRYQYNGEALQLSADNCQQPFGLNKSASHCAAYCYNTCPELNPDRKAAARDNIAHLNIVLSYVDQAISTASDIVAQQQEMKTVAGTVTFVLPAAVSASIMNTVSGLIMNTLPTASPFPISFNV